MISEPLINWSALLSNMKYTYVSGNFVSWILSYQLQKIHINNKNVAEFDCPFPVETCKESEIILFLTSLFLYKIHVQIATSIGPCFCHRETNSEGDHPSLSSSDISQAAVRVHISLTLPRRGVLHWVLAG